LCELGDAAPVDGRPTQDILGVMFSKDQSRFSEMLSETPENLEDGSKALTTIILVCHAILSKHIVVVSPSELKSDILWQIMPVRGQEALVLVKNNSEIRCSQMKLARLSVKLSQCIVKAGSCCGNLMRNQNLRLSRRSRIRCLQTDICVSLSEALEYRRSS
jgi:hypothetical protein